MAAIKTSYVISGNPELGDQELPAILHSALGITFHEFIERTLDKVTRSIDERYNKDLHVRCHRAKGLGQGFCAKPLGLIVVGFCGDIEDLEITLIHELLHLLRWDEAMVESKAVEIHKKGPTAGNQKLRKEVTVDKEQIDSFYHLLRVISNSGKAELTLTIQEGIDIFHGLSRHLLAGGDYLALVKFLQFYGERFLVDPAFEHLSKTGWKYDRVVEFGAGLGWLGRGIASKSGLLPTMFVDKRPWVLIDVIADLETMAGTQMVLEKMKPGDLIVMSEFLHCLDAPKRVMEPFSKWPILALEYCPVNPGYRNSYETQIKRYGARPVSAGAYPGVFSTRKMDVIDLDPYILMLVDKEE